MRVEKLEIDNSLRLKAIRVIDAWKKREHVYIGTCRQGLRQFRICRDATRHSREGEETCCNSAGLRLTMAYKHPKKLLSCYFSQKRCRSCPGVLMNVLSSGGLPPGLHFSPAFCKLCC